MSMGKWFVVIGLTVNIATAQAQAPGPGRTQAPRGPSIRDTVRFIVQPAPTVNVEAPSQVPAIVLGVAGLLLLVQQLRIMARQTDAMNRQTGLLDKQREAMTAQGDLLAKQTALSETSNKSAGKKRRSDIGRREQLIMIKQKKSVDDGKQRGLCWFSAKAVKE